MLIDNFQIEIERQIILLQTGSVAMNITHDNGQRNVIKEILSTWKKNWEENVKPKLTQLKKEIENQFRSILES